MVKYHVLICLFSAAGEVEHPSQRSIWLPLQWNVVFCSSTEVCISLLAQDFFTQILDPCLLFALQMSSPSPQRVFSFYSSCTEV